MSLKINSAKIKKPHQKTSAYRLLRGLVEKQSLEKYILRHEAPPRAFGGKASELQQSLHVRALDIVLLQRYIVLLKVNHRREHKTDRAPLKSLWEMELLHFKNKDLSSWSAGLSSVEQKSIDDDKRKQAEQKRLAKLLATIDTKASKDCESTLGLGLPSAREQLEHSAKAKGFHEMKCADCGGSEVTLRAKGQDGSYSEIEISCERCPAVSFLSLVSSPCIKASSGRGKHGVQSYDPKSKN